TFFERAEEVASTDNFDYAIEMYLEGLRLAPDALEDGHAPLRRIALIRQGKGGKKPTITEKMKRHGGKTPLDELLNAEFLLAKDPDNLSYAETMLRAAVAGGYQRTASWMANLVYEANRSKDKPSYSTWILLKDSFRELELFDNAVAACQKALEMKPEEAPLQNELRDLSAQLTMQRGKYDTDGDFRKAIKDKDVQEQLQAQEHLVKSVDFRQRAVEEAKRAVTRVPSQTNLLALADALVGLETDKGFQDAIKLLDGAHKKYKDFAFKKREGEIRLKRLRSALRAIKSGLHHDPQSQNLKEKLAYVSKKLDEVGLEHFRLCVENYPTDMKLKYEYGLKLVAAKQYDEAIPLFQEAQRDPRYRVTGLAKTGLCFFHKGWYADAIDIFQQALKACENQDTGVAKELRYNLARSFEQDGQKEKALDMFRKLAQQDFGFKDVRERIDALRNSDKTENLSDSE
ncbi:MAG: hypothetical protein JXA82_05560, partial [Sedimentisphaerales bacterium]|nr:hypothetical protein [Sedimentisphaerales bacterium]